MIGENTHDRVSAYARFCFVAQYDDGARLLHYGPTEAAIMDAIAAAVRSHGDVVWYDGVTDQHYTKGRYYLLDDDPGIYAAQIVLDNYAGPLDANGLPPELTDDAKK